MVPTFRFNQRIMNAQLPLLEITSEFSALFCQEEVSYDILFIVYACMSHSIRMGASSDLTLTTSTIKRSWINQSDLFDILS